MGIYFIEQEIVKPEVYHSDRTNNGIQVTNLVIDSSEVLHSVKTNNDNFHEDFANRFILHMRIHHSDESNSI